MSCKLCKLSSYDAEKLWNERVKGWEQAQNYASTIVGAIPIRTLKTHFEQHHPIQPPAPGSLHRPKALKTAHGLTPRQKEILELLSRVAPLTGKQIAEIIYKKLPTAAALASTYRDLRKLILINMLYGWAPPTQPQTWDGTKNKGQTVLYWLGREAIPYAEENRGKGPWNKRVIYNIKEINEQISLQTIKNRDFALHINHISQKAYGEQYIRFLWENWYCDPELQFRFKHPISGSKTKLNLSGIGSIEISEGLNMQQHPFMYLIDSGAPTERAVAKTIIDYIGLTMPSTIGTYFPNIRSKPPLIILTPTIYRLSKIRNTLNTQAKTIGFLDWPEIIVTDNQTFGNAEWTSQTWHKLTATETTKTSFAETLQSTQGMPPEAKIKFLPQQQRQAKPKVKLVK